MGLIITRMGADRLLFELAIARKGMYVVTDSMRTTHAIGDVVLIQESTFTPVPVVVNLTQDVLVREVSDPFFIKSGIVLREVKDGCLLEMVKTRGRDL